MTTDDARSFADGLQERATQMGDRTGEGQYLGQCLAVIRDLAAQIDALAPIDNAKPKRGRPPKDAHIGTVDTE